MENIFNLTEIRGYIDKKAQNVVQCLIEKNLSVSCAESCTGGLLSSAITSVSGASGVFECGVVSYSERIKEELVGVPVDVIERYGVVSAETAVAMAKGVGNISRSDIAVGITGLAGPKSETDVLPVGTVYIAIVFRDRVHAENLRLYELGDFERDVNRHLTVLKVLEKLEELLAGI